jgi:hypothetical protein
VESTSYSGKRKIPRPPPFWQEGVFLQRNAPSCILGEAKSQKFSLYVRRTGNLQVSENFRIIRNPLFSRTQGINAFNFNGLYGHHSLSEKTNKNISKNYVTMHNFYFKQIDEFKPI